jgi:hypothetical protein
MDKKWFSLFNSEGAELLHRGGKCLEYDPQTHKYQTTSVQTPDLNQKTLLRTLFSISHTTCTHTVQTLITHSYVSMEGENKFTVLHFLPIYDCEDTKKLIMIMFIAQESSTNNSHHLTCIYAKHNVESDLHAIHSFMKLLLGDMKYSHAHGDNISSFKRRLQYLGEVIDGILISDQSERGFELATRMQLYVALPIQSFAFKCSNLGDKQLKKLAQSKLQKYSGSDYWSVTHVALFVKHALFTATTEWLAQSTAELCTLSLYLHFLSPATARDIPIHYRNRAVRLVTVKLDEITEMCMICGPNPQVHSVIRSIISEDVDWEFVQRIKKQYLNQNALIKSLKFEPSLYCFLYVDRSGDVITDDNNDRENSFFMFETLAVPSYYEELPHVTTNVLPPSQALEKATLDFYISISTKVFQSHKHISQHVIAQCHEETPFTSPTAPTKKTTTALVEINESYMTTKNFALCAIRKGNRELYCVFDVAVPHYALLGISRETLDIIQGKIQDGLK